MHHCVGSMAELGARGVRYFYRAVVGGQRVTLAVVPAAEGWRLDDAAGFANSRIQHPALVARWLAALPPRA